MAEGVEAVKSYCVATGTGPRPRHIRHILVNADEGEPLCGKGRVRFVGAGNQPYGEGWPWCSTCVEIAGPDIVGDWTAEA